MQGRDDEDTGGSSPLARGLLLEEQDGPVVGRIIPARAGFTLRPEVRHLLAQDHPRSRGVYRSIRTMASTGMGSSPLARGLQTGSDELIERIGIIPARAGFTAWT